MKKVSIEQKKYIFEDIFKIEEAHLRFEKFNGEITDSVRRISLERGDSVAVVILNLTPNKIILVSQFRYPSEPPLGSIRLHPKADPGQRRTVCDGEVDGV